MWTYIIRRILYSIPILIAINVITFMLFFKVNTPDDMARAQLGHKNVKPAAIERWKKEHNYDLPAFVNYDEVGLKTVTETLFFQKSVKLFMFEFGNADNGRNIGADIKKRMGPSLAIAVPTLIFGLVTYITFALLLAFFRASYIDVWGVVICIIIMSISTMFYIIGGQFLISKTLHLVPISGYDSGINAFKFLILPVMLGVFWGIGGTTRWYRTIFLEEINKDYIRTARSKGLSENIVLFKHVLRNAMIPILTGVVTAIPLLFIGALVTESFFGIPGLGSYTIEGIRAQDFGIVRAMVFLGAVLYIVGLILTDISYTVADPRVRLS